MGKTNPIGPLTPIYRVQRTNRWRPWALVAVLVALAALVVGGILLAGDSDENEPGPAAAASSVAWGPALGR